MKIATIGIDISKNVFQIHGMDEKGRCVLTKRLSRDKFPSFMANLDPTLIGMEACGGSHHWARILKSQGHEVKLMSPQGFVRQGCVNFLRSPLSCFNV